MPSVPASIHRTRVAVCVATYRRPALLAQLLDGLSALTFTKVPVPDITVVIVDNDSARSAEPVCLRNRLPWNVRYAVEPRRGIAQARNRALREAADLEFIAFIDDDEAPAPSWLDELLAAQAQFAADVVCGLVIPSYAPGVPAWIRAGRFFERPVPAAGSAPETFSTNNVLLRAAVLAYVHGFDERFSFTGGEDTQFFLRVRAAGFSIVSSGAAVVRETVPLSRANLRWMLRRAYQCGNSWVLCESSLDPRLSTRALRFFKASARIGQGSLGVLLSPLGGRVAFTRALRTVCLGAGMLTALFGQRFEPYRGAASSAVEPGFSPALRRT